MEQTPNAQNVMEVTVAELEVHIEDMKLVNTLVKTKEWKRIIDELYLKDEAIRLVNASGNLTLTSEQKANIFGMMTGIPAIQSFINRITVTGYQAMQDLEDYKNENSSSASEMEDN